MHELTADPCLPVEEALLDVLELEFLTTGAELVVLLQPTDNESTFFLCQKLCGVWEVLDDEERRGSGEYCHETFEDEDPRPGRLAANILHIRYCGLHVSVRTTSLWHTSG